MKKKSKELKIGFIGNGYVGKHIADDIESRGYTTVRYALEAPFNKNKKAVSECDIVFVAVPTPTTPHGFNGRIVDEAISYVKPGRVVVIKSTVTPGTTKQLQEKYPKHTILFAPEFLREATAAYDAAHPFSVIVGTPAMDDVHGRAAAQVLEILPDAPHKEICGSTEAEMTKYAQNIMGYANIVFFNLLYELMERIGGDWQVVRRMLEADPDTASRFANPLHKGGRGAGGSCLIKDFAAVREMYGKVLPGDKKGLALIRAMEEKNLELLISTNKTMDIVRAVYGDVPASKRSASTRAKKRTIARPH